MNFVFWLFIILILIAIWFILVPVFRIIGRGTKRKIDETNEVISKEEKENN